MVTAEIVKKDQTMYGLIVKVHSVDRTFENNRADKPEVIVGKNMILAGFWRRKEVYSSLNVGDKITTGAKHEVSNTDVLSAFEGLRKIAPDTK